MGKVVMIQKARKCLECGCEFYSQRPRLTCSTACAFWVRVDKTAGDDACWPWTGHTSKFHGYGDVPAQYSPTGKRTLAHRVAYHLYHICDPGLLCVLHRCDNRICSNPKHLFLGTKKVNNFDAWLKGRACIAPGQDNWNAKLNNNNVVYIRNSNEPVSELAKRFGVARNTVYAVLAGSSWKHLLEERQAWS